MHVATIGKSPPQSVTIFNTSQRRTEERHGTDCESGCHASVKRLMRVFPDFKGAGFPSFYLLSPAAERGRGTVWKRRVQTRGRLGRVVAYLAYVTARLSPYNALANDENCMKRTHRAERRQMHSQLAA
jgi:hypothetical protein